MSARALALLAIALGLVAGEGALAQSVSVQAPSGPNYLGDPVPIQVIVDGFDEEPTPSIAAPELDRGRLVFAGVSPNVSSSIVIVGGQVRRSKEVKFVFSYELRVDQAGAVTVGPFVVTQGAIRKATDPLRFEFRDVPGNDQLAVELEFPEASVYLGERVPISVQFRLSGSIRENLHRYTLRVPLFDLNEAFRFIEPAEPGETDVKIQTANGEQTLKADAKVSEVGGEQTLVVTIRRIAVPLRDGPLQIPPTILDVEEGTRFRRDLFGGRQATHVRKWRAQDRARRFVVKRIPVDHTPPSFAGAVGSGFSLRVSADRTVVQVGEPIALHLELRGDGNLETASLPPLDAEGLLPSTQFRVPDGEATGQLSDGAKQFTATVRVVDPSVREIPALEYSWFDPESETFHSTRSLPIALSVRDAQIIGAAQVQRETPDAAAAEAPGQPAEIQPAGRGALVLTGADLAIERDPERLTRVMSAGSGGAWGVTGLYLGSLFIVGVAHFDRRRRDVDPKRVARRRRVDEWVAAVRSAGELPSAQAAGQLASALRALVAEAPEAAHADVDALVGECDARSYAPASQHSNAPLAPEFVARAVELAERIAEAAR